MRRLEVISGVPEAKSRTKDQLARQLGEAPMSV
jgi:hypothetical protein